MYKRAIFIILLVLIGLVAAPLHGQHTDPCRSAVKAVNQKLATKIDEVELLDILAVLKKSQRLPDKFVTKSQAAKLGWKPGQDLWKKKKLYGKSIGGDLFQNRENKLPGGKQRYYEADLDYKGGKRNAKRLIFTREGKCYVTVDHYQTFIEVPACR
jgi:ribonuclease T1